MSHVTVPLNPPLLTWPWGWAGPVNCPSWCDQLLDSVRWWALASLWGCQLSSHGEHTDTSTTFSSTIPRIGLGGHVIPVVNEEPHFSIYISSDSFEDNQDGFIEYTIIINSIFDFYFLSIYKYNSSPELYFMVGLPFESLGIYASEDWFSRVSKLKIFWQKQRTNHWLWRWMAQSDYQERSNINPSVM